MVELHAGAQFTDSLYDLVNRTPDINNPLVFNQPTITIPDGDYIVFGHLVIPAGMSMNVMRVGIIQSNGTVETAGLEVVVYNETDAAAAYTSDESLDDGTYAAPLATIPENKRVSMRLMNNTGGALTASGFVSVTVT